MKYFKGLFLLMCMMNVVSAFGPMAMAAKTPGKLLYSCSENLRAKSYQVIITDGVHHEKLAYNSFLELKTDDYEGHHTEVSAQAFGYSTHHCATRANPCVMQTSVQYETQNPAMIFTLTFNDAAPFVSESASLDIYSNGLGSEIVESIPLDCAGL